MSEFTPYVARHYTGDRHEIVIVYERGSKLHVLAMDDGVRCRDLPRREEDAMIRLHMTNMLPYPVKRALRTFKRMAKSHGTTSRGKRILKQLAATV